MTITVRELIEHLSQYDSDLEVLIRDQENVDALISFPAHAVQLETIEERKPAAVVVIG